MSLAERSFKIKNLEIKNRLSVPPMVCFQWTDENGYVVEKNLKHYEDIAKGGFGLVIVEATAVTQRARLGSTELGLWEDGQIEGFRKIADVIHQHGAKAFVQLLHAGINGIDKEPDGPVDGIFRGGNVGHEMSEEKIHATSEAFAQAARRAEAAGFDGIEIHGCHGYLYSQFMSSKVNTRTDKYGVDKTLATKECLQAIRNAVSENFLVGIRVAAYEPTLEEGLQNIKELADYSDFMDVSYGYQVNAAEAYKPEGFRLSAAVYGASRVKEMLPDMPVFAVDNINSAEDVEEALALGIDMTDIGRAALVDPAFASHVLNGEKEGKCLHCPKDCRWNPWNMGNEDMKCPGEVLYSRNK